jgi:hypothetical protein
VKRAAILAAALATSLAFAGRAEAYVRYKATNGKMFQWSQTCVPMVLYPTELPLMTPAEIENAVDASAATWSAGANSCTYLDISVLTATGTPPRAANDARNNVIFRSSTWCKQIASGGCDPNVPYDPAALALTSVSAGTSTGIIKDADIEINAFHFNWADLVAHPELGTAYHDLQNAVTHEMGHVIGLDHTCYLQPPAPLDQNGNPIPDCASAPPDVLETTMFPSANPGDVDKRTLAPDDIQGVCDIYPIAQDPKSCVPPSPPDSGGCAMARTAGSASGLAGVLAFIVASTVASARRRRRRG